MHTPTRSLRPGSGKVGETVTHSIRAARVQAPNGIARTAGPKRNVNSSMVLKIRFLDYL